jgi:tRNA(fMet)-specific endonuclease VapC
MREVLRVFDSSFLIDLTQADPEAAKLARLVDEERSVAAISVVSMHEYMLGVHLRYFQDKELLNSKLEAAERDLMPFTILPLTKEIVMDSARIQAALTKRGQTIGINDVYIAATARVSKAPVVTRNISHFRHVEGLNVEKY